MLALVSIPGTALSETWDQKLDLTIPSLEMPLTWQLDSKAKHEIMMGWTCCYHPSLVTAVHKEHSNKLIQSRLKVRQNQLQFTPVEPITTKQLAAFGTLQLLDIYTTYRGLKYDCVREINPVIGEKPSVGKMFFVKAVALTPAIRADLKNNRLTTQDLKEINGLMLLVVLNNYDVWQRSSERCNKR